MSAVASQVSYSRTAFNEIIAILFGNFSLRKGMGEVDACVETCNAYLALEGLLVTVHCLPIYEVHTHEVRGREMHAYKVHTCAMHVYEVRTHEMHACEVQVHAVHAYEVYANEIHAHDVHAREVHAYECTPMRCTPVRYTPMTYTPMRCTPMRYMPMRCTPVRVHAYECTPMRCTPMRYTPMRCTPMRCTPVTCTKDSGLREMVLGKEYPSTVTSMANLTMVLSGQGEYEQVEEMHRQALGISGRDTSNL